MRWSHRKNTLILRLRPSTYQTLAQGAAEAYLTWRARVSVARRSRSGHRPALANPDSVRPQIATGCRPIMSLPAFKTGLAATEPADLHSEVSPMARSCQTCVSQQLVNDPRSSGNSRSDARTIAFGPNPTSPYNRRCGLDSQHQSQQHPCRRDSKGRNGRPRVRASKRDVVGDVRTEIGGIREGATHAARAAARRCGVHYRGLGSRVLVIVVSSGGANCIYNQQFEIA